MNNQKKLLIITAIVVCGIQLSASVVREDTPYQYYRDFAENRGMFVPGATNLKIKLKDGTIQPLNISMPDFSSATSTARFPGIANLIQGQFTTTCAHNPGFYNERIDPITHKDTGNGTNYLATMTFGKGSTYEYKMVSEHDHPQFKTIDNHIGGNHIDFAVPRLNKLVTEVAPPKRFDNFPKIYAENPERFTALARVGSGRQHILKDGDMIKQSDGSYKMVMIPRNQLDTAYQYLTGGLAPMEEMMIEPNNDQILIKQNNDFKKRVPLGTSTTNGDSGSPIYVYDNQDKEWKWLGNVLGSYTDGKWNNQDLSNYDIFSEPNGYVNKIIDSYTVKIKDTNPNEEYHWKINGKNYYSLNDTSFSGKGDDKSYLKDEKIRALDDGKNIVLQGGGTIILDQNVNQGAGTITFKDDYIVKGINNDISWIGGGLDIAEGKNIEWQVKGEKGDSLHKIGKGTLTINGDGENKGDISIGDGTLILDQNGGKAFNNIEIVSGRPTVIMVGSNQVESSNNISFGFRGGKLDLNAQDMEFKGGIKALDFGANVTNSNDTVSSITISESSERETPSGYFRPNEIRTTSGDMVYHGKISGNINTTITGKSGEMLFDGEINTPNNTLIIKKDIVLQGHPIIHAYTDSKSFANNDWEDITIADKLKANFNDNSLLTKPVSINQQDWENRNFKLKHIDLRNGKTLTIGRNAIVDTEKLDIGKSSTVNLGTTNVIVDEKDGDGIIYQHLVKGKSDTITDKDRAIFNGNINGNGSTINMQYAVVTSSINDKDGIVNINDKVDWNLIGNTNIKDLNIKGNNVKISLSTSDKNNWNKTILTTDNLTSSNQTYELTVYPKIGDGDRIVVNKSAKGSNNKLKLDFINPSSSGDDIKDKIILASTPKDSTENGLDYFEADSRLNGFSIYQPNIIKEVNGDKNEWYLKKTEKPASQKLIIPDNTETSNENISNSNSNRPISVKPSSPRSIGIPIIPSYFTAVDNIDYIKDIKGLMNTQESIFINENELLTKRLGELRSSNVENGIWCKVQAHQNNLDGVKLKGKTVELGADTRKNNNIYGLFGSYSDGKTSIKDGYNDFKYGGVGIYYTYLADNGIFIDCVGKYLKTSQKIKLSTAKNSITSTEVFNKAPRKSTNMVMGSIQSGVRKSFGNGYFIEPSVKLTSGHMEGYKVKGKDGAIAEVTSSNPIYSEAGIQFGKKYINNLFSISAGIHHQQRIGEKGKIVLTDREKVRTYHTMDSERIVTNISANGNITDSLNLYGRIEKSFGGNYKTDYSTQVGIRYKF